MATNNEYDNLYYVRDDINTRYATFRDPGSNGAKNFVYDSFIPGLMLKGGDDIRRWKRNVPATGYAISEWFSNEFNLRQLPFSYMLDILGISRGELKRTLLDVKRKKIRLALIGAGGTNQNFIHWAEKMMEEMELVNLFDEIYIYDKDDVEFTNLLRFPFDINKMSFNLDRGWIPKVSIAKAKIKLLCKEARIHIRERNFEISDTVFPFHSEITKKYLCDVNFDSEDATEEKMRKLKEQDPIYYDYINKNYSNYTLPTTRSIQLPKDDIIFYGAPDIRTRAMVEEVQRFMNAKQLGNFKFVAGLHGDDSCDLTVRPSVNESLQIEGYGVIRLAPFFMNQVMMTYNFLKFLAIDDEDKWNQNNNQFFSYSFKDAEKFPTSTKKVINFQSEHDGTIEEIN